MSNALTGEGTTGAVPTFTLGPFDGLGAQLCPCSLVTVTPQSFTVTSQPGDISGPGVPRILRVRAATQPSSVRFELVDVS